MKSILFFFLSASIIFPQVNQILPTRGDNLIQIVGVVLDSASGKPIRGAEVEILGLDEFFVTGDDGRFILNLFSAEKMDSYRLLCNKSGYWPSDLLISASILPVVIILKKELDLLRGNDANRFFRNSKASLKVLILPFEPLEDCDDRIIRIEEALQKRLLDQVEKNNLDVEVKFLSNLSCPESFAEGKKVGKQYGADLILWGDYIENCEVDSSIAAIKYSFCSEILGDYKWLGDEFDNKTEIESISGKLLTEGLLPNNINTIILFILGLTSSLNNDCPSALQYLKMIEYGNSFAYSQLLYAITLILQCSPNAQQNVCNFYEEMIKKYPDNFLFIKEYSQFYLTENYTEKAISILESFIEKNQNISCAYTMRAGFSKDIKAIEILEKALEIFPYHIYVLQLLADLYIAQNNYQAAINCALRGVDAIENNLFDFNELEEIDRDLWQRNHSFEQTRKDNYCSFLMMLSEIYLYQDNLDSALYYAERLFYEEPNKLRGVKNILEILAAKEDIEIAIEFLQKYLSLPNFMTVDIYREIVWFLEENDKCQLALEYIDKCIKQFGHEYYPYHLLVHNTCQKDTLELLETLNIAKEKFLGSAEFYQLLSWVYLEKKDTANAERLYLEFLSNNKDSVSEGIEVARLFSDIGMYNKANDILLSILERCDDSLEVFLELGNNYIQLGKLGKAIEVLENAKRIQLKKFYSFDLNIYSNFSQLIDLYIKEGEYQKAKMYAEVMIQKSPVRLENWELYSNIYESMGELDKCLDVYFGALRYLGDDSSIFYKIGSLYERLKNDSLAVEYYKKAVNSDIFDISSFEKLCVLYEKKGLHSSVLNLCDSVLSFNSRTKISDLNSIKYSKGKAFYLNEFYDEAEKIFRSLVKDSGSDIVFSSYIYLGHINKKRGKMDASKSYYLKALEVNPNCDIHYYHYLAKVYLEMGKKEKVIEIYENYLASERTKENYGWLYFANKLLNTIKKEF